VEDPPPVLHDALDHEIIAAARPALERGEPVRLEFAVTNRNRTVGGLLSSAIASIRGEDGLPDGTVTVTLCGSAGQSFGAWLAHGVEFTLWGEANDYAGKGLSGGVLTVRPRRGRPRRRGQRHRRQHRPVRRHVGPGLLPGPGRGAVRGP